MPDTIELNPGGAGSLNIAFKLRYEANENTNAFTDADKAKLAGQETGATADMTPEEVQGAYDSQVPVMSQAEAEAGASTAVRQVTAQRIAQAIAAQVVGGGGNLGTDMRLNGFGIGFAGANATGAQIARLTPVCLDGAALAIAVSEADKTDRLPCIGVAAADIADAASGDVISYGMITAVDSAAWAVGAPLYVGSTGGLTDTAPVDAAVQEVARVVTSDPTDGVLFVNIRAEGRPIGALGTGEALTGADLLLFGDASADHAPAARTLADVLLDLGNSGDLGTRSSGTETLVFSAARQQRLTNGGAFALAPPSTGEGRITLELANGASAGAVTLTGWDSVTGATLDSTSGNRFLCAVTVIGGQSYLAITAHSGNA